MATTGGTLVWFRRDLRLSDHVALTAAAARGGPVHPVFILDDVIAETYGAAPKWRLARGLEALDGALRERGSRLILRRGPALRTVRALIAETGADAVYWSRLYDPDAIARDSAVKAALTADGVAAKSFPGLLLHEPPSVTTKAGGFFKVYSPFWRAVSAAPPPAAPLPTPERIPAPARWPESLSLQALDLDRGMRRGAAIVARHVTAGEAAAQARLAAFLEGAVAEYAVARNRADQDGGSRLSHHLAVGEISPRQIWSAVAESRAAGRASGPGAETFLKEVVWREFAWHLLFHTPHIATRNWREDWDRFPWRADNPDAERWRQGRTGVPMVDAAMRELYVTGVMHNRTRMLTASYLTKHLLTDWRVGEAWFRDCLIDWDPASNAMGWQWTAGSGPDAAPYFRIFNAETQRQKFDPSGDYVARWLPEVAARDLARAPQGDGLSFFDACPIAWGLSAEDAYPAPMIEHAAGRARALAAYETLKNPETEEKEAAQ